MINTMKPTPLLLILASSLLLTACERATTRFVASETFGTTSDGREVQLYTLVNINGLRAEISNYGGTMVRLLVPDRDGALDDILLGFDNLADYQERSPYFGCLIGRFGNRIAGGRFELDGETYQLAANNDPGGIPCHLHGGERGFDKVVWEAEPVYRDDASGLRLSRLSPDGEEGYPGNLSVTVHYWLTDDDTLRIEYMATTDRPTPVNLTQHNYYNLRGEGDGDINGHELMIHARRFTPVDAGLIPTGELRPVFNTPFNFTTPHAIGHRVDQDDEQLRFGLGYDHNWVLDSQDGSLAKAAMVFEPTTGRIMEVWTTEPGLQFYGGNFLDGTLTGKSGKPYPHRSGFCLETQHYPDSPNQPGFPSTILRPGETYQSVTEYRFRTD
jgi:aldose 1-epimerase